MHGDQDFDDGEGDLLSPLTETEFLQLLLRDFHDDLPGRITRLRYLADQAGTLGSAGAMIVGGSPAYNAYTEARSSFVNGNYAATIILCQAMAENLLAAAVRLDGTEVPNRVAFAETLRLCEAKGYVTRPDCEALKKLANLRNPLAHYRSLDDPTHVDRRSLNEKTHFLEILERDAFFAVALIMHILSKRPFRIGS
ncbi:hypothetical protein IP78_13545 [Brevundimonas sp. AAP58]|nr:hypothetical protein IP78_13545 [Brevundimonas sp. AAP58]